jgi:hypothetical protein
MFKGLNTLDFYRKNGLNVKNFTTFPKNKYKNLHYLVIDSEIKFVDVFSDIFIIGMADKLMSNSKGGFINLVRFINRNKLLKYWLHVTNENVPESNAFESKHGLNPYGASIKRI